MTITNENAIRAYMHCGLCLQELRDGKAPGESPESYARLTVGSTDIGWQVWCVRHDCNVVHIDYEGHVHPANLTRLLRPGEVLPVYGKPQHELKREVLKRAPALREATFGPTPEGCCVTCKQPVVTPFRDEPSKKEFDLSGMCQHCQDAIFVDIEDMLLRIGYSEDNAPTLEQMLDIVQDPATDEEAQHWLVAVIYCLLMNEVNYGSQKDETDQT